MSCDGGGRAVRDVGQVGVGSRLVRERRRIRVKPEADLTAPLLDERREPIRKWGLAQ
jgi:hypothetical protein